LGEPARFIPVSVSGRIFHIETKGDFSITAIQSALQHHLQMEGQMFHLFNCKGKLLLTDLQVLEAVTEHLTPLCATHIAVSTVCIESRHETLAPMQSTLYKEHMKDATDVVLTGKQVNEAQKHADIRKRDMHMFCDKARNDILKMLVNEYETWKTELGQLSERVNAVEQVVGSACNKHELSLLDVNKRVQEVHDWFNSESLSHEHELSKCLTLLEDCISPVVEMTHSKETQDKHATEIHVLNQRVDAISGYYTEILQDQLHSLNQRVDAISGYYTEELQDQLHSFKDSVESIAVSLEQQSDETEEINLQGQRYFTETSLRFTELEEHFLAIESCFTDASGLLATGIDQLIKRYESLSTSVEDLQNDLSYHVGLQSAQGSAQDTGTVCGNCRQVASNHQKDGYCTEWSIGRCP